MAIHIDRLVPALGGKITGVDLCGLIEDETAGIIRAALAKYGVLAFPDQDISDEAHIRFSRHFGELGVFRDKDNPDGLAPEIFRLANTDLSGRLFPADSERLKLLKLNGYWHTDTSYRSVPIRGAILHGIEVIDDGGDTIFVNMVAAYEALPAAMKTRITGLAACHRFEFQVINRGLPSMSEEERARLPAVEHPLVRQHADGRRSLYLSPPYMETIVGWNQQDSQALIEELTGWAAQDRFTYRHRWRPHDVLMWDNGWTMHRVTAYDFERRKRTLHGTLIMGSESIQPVSIENSQ